MCPYCSSPCISCGLIAINKNDFKGNPIAPKRTYTADATQHPDWTTIGSVTLEIASYTTDTVFDALNRPVEVITPDSGSTLYAYDKGGFLQSLSVENIHSLDTDIINNIEYDAKGQRQKVQYENGTTTTYEYDAFTFRVRRIRTTRHIDSKELQDLRYWYDAVGNITLQKDLAQQSVYFDGSVADPHYDYTYDALYRLIQAEGREHAGNNAAPTYNDSSRTGITPIPIASTDTAKMRRYIQYYEYDEVGNFIQMRHTVTGGTGNWTRYYTTDNGSNRFLETVIGSGTPEAYDYDNRGNIVKGFGHLQILTFNAMNRLEKIAITDTQTVYYQYDIAGQRVRKTLVNTAANQTEVRKYVGSWEIYSKFVSSSLILERETLHISDDSGRMALIDTRTTGTGSEPAQLLRYQYSNHLGTATFELDDAGAIISYEEYYPYGSTSFQSGRTGAEVALKRYRYTGKERDEESGLYYHGARYYIPWLARWLSPDPINNENYNIQKGNPQRNKERDFLEFTISPYCYCANNPVNKIDPNGEKEFKNYNEYKAYQQQNKQEVLAKDKIGDQGHWLKADRTGNTDVWDAANWHNIKNEKEGQYAPFEQIRDLYKWVRKEAKNQGHDVRWMMGADLLVSELPMIDYFSSLLPAGFNDLMKELNLNIANFAIHKFKELLVDRGEQKPIIGAEAYFWDKEFIEVEQGKVAPPVYKKYQKNYPRAIDFLNVISQKAVTDRAINSTVSMYLEIFGEIPAMEVSVMDDQYRIDFPLLMLYPNRHKPTHKEVIKHQKERKLEFMKIKFPKISN